MEWNDVVARIQRAIDTFMDRDSYLLEVMANERSMTHKLAEYLTLQFADERWDVDCEYNRREADPKRLRRIFQEPVPPDDLDARTVYPDIIVHRRGTNENLLVIEAKKATLDDATDLAKLSDFRNDPLYSYQHGAQIIFEADPPNILLRRFVA